MQAAFSCLVVRKRRMTSYRKPACRPKRDPATFRDLSGSGRNRFSFCMSTRPCNGLSIGVDAM
jgi:hypothetical protein